jgi:hypothetical protein
MHVNAPYGGILVISGLLLKSISYIVFVRSMRDEEVMLLR